VYGKGAWVFHMLRVLLRDPEAADPDARFTRLLKTLVSDYRHRGLSTAALQREIEKIMTPAMDLEEDGSMDWFFDQWVRGTEIPKYLVTYKATLQGNRYVVRGTLKQEGVSGVFTAPVPLYAETGRSQRTLLGTVVTSGGETAFRFTTRALPKRILIDPEMTLLAVTQ
jgi:aminopeptidase N